MIDLHSQASDAVDPLYVERNDIEGIGATIVVVVVFVVLARPDQVNLD